MNLLPKYVISELPKLYATENDADPIVRCKFFLPGTKWTWYVLEYDGEDNFFGYGIGGQISAELSSIRQQFMLDYRDPYFLDFLGLKGAYQGKDIEAAILRELESFILEIGTGFSFLARQKRMIIGNGDFYLDLLFFHRELRRLVAIELKLDKFRPEHKGQMELYLRWLDKYERKPDEKHPLGLILCAGKSDEQVELLELGKSGIRVAEYVTQIPPRAVLEKKLHEAIQNAKAMLENKGINV